MENQLTTTISCGNIHQVYNPKNLIATCKKITSPIQAANSGMPSLARLEKEVGREYVIRAIIVNLIFLQNAINVKTKLNEQQMLLLCNDILDTYPMNNINFADVNIVFTRARRGEYGELYESLSIDKVYQWFSKYFEERCGMAEEESINEHDKNKNSRAWWK